MAHDVLPLYDGSDSGGCWPCSLCARLPISEWQLHFWVSLDVYLCKLSYTVPFLKKHTLRVSGGYISSQCRLRSTQWSPGWSMGIVNSENAPGLNSRPSACGPSVCGRREAAFVGITMGFHAAQGHPPQIRLSPWFPRSLGPLAWASALAISIAG